MDAQVFLSFFLFTILHEASTAAAASHFPGDTKTGSFFRESRGLPVRYPMKSPSEVSAVCVRTHVPFT